MSSVELQVCLVVISVHSFIFCEQIACTVLLLSVLSS